MGVCICNEDKPPEKKNIGRKKNMMKKKLKEIWEAGGKV